MKHPSEEELALLYYGEAAAGVEQHVAACDECRLAYGELAEALGRLELPPAPERGPEYGREVWQRVQAKLSAAPERSKRTLRQWLFAPRGWAVAAAMAAVLVAAFLAGRWSRPRPPGQAITPQVRERVLLVAVGDHLERSQMVLLELVNTRPEGTLDISEEQRRAQDLIAANRLYRQTAARAGEPGVAGVLDELERVLLEIAHSPSRLSSQEFEELRHRVEAQGILFKVRIIDSRIREKELRSS